MNPKTKLTNGRLELLRKLDSFFLDYTITLSDEPSFTMTTGSRSSASDSRGMGMKKKSKDQGHLIVANGDGA